MVKKAIKNTDQKHEGFDSVRYRNEYIRLNYDRITLAVKKGRKEKWNTEARACAMSLSEYITRKVDGDL